MKRYGFLYDKICDIENIREAHKNASKGKSNYKIINRINENPDLFLLKIKETLESETFVNSEYHIFTKMCGIKERTIYSLPYFPDRIIHHAIMQVLEPIWKSTLIRNTFSSIKGRGIHDGVVRLKYAIQNHNSKYCLKLDIKKFYPSIDNEILKSIIRKKIKCERTLNLLDIIINSTKGVPIGNYLSQYFSNIYLSGLDHFIKEELNVKCYFRYCDDLVLLSDNKPFLHSCLFEIDTYITEKLNLKIKSNYQVFPLTKGIDFLGYRFFPLYTILRKSIYKNFIHKISVMYKNPHINGLMSFCGWLKYTNNTHLYNKYIDYKFKNHLLTQLGNKKYPFYTK